MGTCANGWQVALALAGIELLSPMDWCGRRFLVRGLVGSGDELKVAVGSGVLLRAGPPLLDRSPHSVFLFKPAPLILASDPSTTSYPSRSNLDNEPTSSTPTRDKMKVPAALLTLALAGAAVAQGGPELPACAVRNPIHASCHPRTAGPSRLTTY